MALARDLMVAVDAFVGSLDPAARALTLLPFDDDGRRDWAYWPTERQGVRLADVGREAAKAASRLLATALSPPAFAQANLIAALDEVLDRAEGWAGGLRRHARDYWVQVHGDHRGDDPWGWRFEGHHVSVHVTVHGDDVRILPLFLGANPARIEHDGRLVAAPLAAEEELGFELLHALSVEQRAVALISEAAPDDIVTRNRPSVGPDVVPEGVPVSQLTGGARSAADALVRWYVERVPAEARPAYDLTDAHFAWAGGDELGLPHYYRLQGSELLVELDNTQNDANHVHTVWRDLRRDFGTDLLAAHREHEH